MDFVFQEKCAAIFRLGWQIAHHYDNFLIKLQTQLRISLQQINDQIGHFLQRRYGTLRQLHTGEAREQTNYMMNELRALFLSGEMDQEWYHPFSWQLVDQVYGKICHLQYLSDTINQDNKWI